MSTFAFHYPTAAQPAPREDDFSKIVPVTGPEGTILEVGGLVALPDGNIAVSTRRGDIFIIENPNARKPFFRKFASGLHEVLGLTYKNGSFYCVQRGELTKLTDTDQDGRADKIEAIFTIPVSGNYHEYSYGPKIAPDGSLFLSTNVSFHISFRGESRVPWRGWVLKVSEDGKMEPWATGMRSPCGLGMIDGELFYTDNQGEWMASGGIWHLKKGAWTGHVAGLDWTKLPGSPLNLTAAQVYEKVDPQFRFRPNGSPLSPQDNPDKVIPLFSLKEDFPNLQLPAVWLPHAIMGVSNSEIVKIPQGLLSPFSGQLLVGDQGQNKIMRVFMEKIKGEYQGAVFDFRSGFQSGVLRMDWGKDGSLFVGETNRGWGSEVGVEQGIERLIWNDRLPFEMKTVRAMPDGFEVEFTQPADRTTLENLSAYSVNSFIYKYHPVYGSPPVNKEANPIRGVKVSPDGLKVLIVVDKLRTFYIHELSLPGVRSATDSHPLLHPVAYYTLNAIPDGEALKVGEIIRATPEEENKGKSTLEASSATKSSKVQAEEVRELLAKNTCLACHETGKRKIGPAYTDVARRNYSNEQIVDLIYKPRAGNWPDYATEMPPMPQVPREEALKIAAWINSLKNQK